MGALFPNEKERGAHLVHDAIEVVQCLSLTSHPMAKTLRAQLTLGLILAAVVASAQGGIRAIFWNYEPVFVDYVGGTHVGLGYDQDLNEFVSFGVDLRYGVDTRSWVANYHSAFHLSDNEAGSFYLGPTVGLRQVRSDDPRMLFPLGFRIGVRGGLERFYADIHAGFHYNVGAGEPVTFSRGSDEFDLQTGTFCVGLEFGWGWDARSRRER